MDAAGDGDAGISPGEAAGVSYADFRSMAEAADRKFAAARDLAPHGRGGPAYAAVLRSAFKAYTKLWRTQQERRRELLAGGLRRFEIGELASRIGQLYYGQYLRTSDRRFLLLASVFYEAILSRGYFNAAEGGAGAVPDIVVRYKELRFHARFIVVAMLVSRAEAVADLAERLRKLVEESKAAWPGTSFKEWKHVVLELGRFLAADKLYKKSRPLRYDIFFDLYPSSQTVIAKFHTRRVLGLKEAILATYYRNEVKFTELTLDTFRMIQCLEWDQSTASSPKVITENGMEGEHNGTSGLIDVNLASDMIDPSSSENPRKAIIYHPCVSNLLAVIASACEELSPSDILLIYIAASGNSASRKTDAEHNSRAIGSLSPIGCSESSLWLGPHGTRASNNLYPDDLIPFTRSPLFLIIDSENSHIFKAIHGSEREEAAALLLSPRRQVIRDSTNSGRQFTYFLTSPLQAFCQLVGLSPDIDASAYSDAESVIYSAFAEWEEILCMSEGLHRVWAQVMPDPFLRRIILRFIFCRTVLFHFHPLDEHPDLLPICLPKLPDSVLPDTEPMKAHTILLAKSLGIANHFRFGDSSFSNSHRKTR